MAGQMLAPARGSRLLPPGGCGKEPLTGQPDCGKTPGARLRTALSVSRLSLFGFLPILLLLAPGPFPRKHVGRLFRAAASLPPRGGPAVLETFQRADYLQFPVYRILGRHRLLSRKHRTSKAVHEAIWMMNVILYTLDICGGKRKKNYIVTHYPES